MVDKNQLSSTRTAFEACNPWTSLYQPNRYQVAILRCPSDPGRMAPSITSSLARTNYAFNCGDNQIDLGSNTIDDDISRGPFGYLKQYPLSTITDGTSNTILFAEAGTPDQGVSLMATLTANQRIQGRRLIGIPLNALPTGVGLDVNECRKSARDGIYPGTNLLRLCGGTYWLDARPMFNCVNTIIGPNGASCQIGNGMAIDEDKSGIFTSNSYHFGGAHVVMVDCTVRFVSNEIDTGAIGASNTNQEYYSPGKISGAEGSPNWGKPSPFGVWGALGTRSSSEIPSDAK